MSESAWAAEPGFDQIERGHRWTWIMGGLLLLVLAGATVLLYYMQVQTDPAHSVSANGPLTLAAGLLGLVLVFGLYAVQKQRTLARIRQELIHRRLQEEGLRSRLGELSALFDVAGEVNLQFELDPLLEVIARRVLTSLEADRSSIFLLNSTQDELECRAVSGSEAAAVREARVRVGEGIAGWVAENNEPLVLNDNETVRRFAAEVRPGRGVATALCVPISAGSKALGVMNLSRIEGVRPFTPADARLLQIFAENVASAITRIRQFEALGEKAGQLEAARQSLARSNRMKEVLLAALRNELRGPCRVLAAYADFLASDSEELRAEKRRTLATIIREQVQRLEGLTAHIQSLGRLDAPESDLRIDPCSPNKLVAEVTGALTAAAASNGSNLVTRLEPGLQGFPMDAGLFQQSARALVNGALSVAEKNAEISLASRAETVGWTFEVRARSCVQQSDLEAAWAFFEDSGHNGNGGEHLESDEDHEYFEEEFEDGPESLGLALYLARRVGELHGGGASAYIDANQDLVLRLHLPCRANLGGVAA